MKSISTPPWPDYTDEEIDAVAAVLRSGKVNYWTGQITGEFEAAFANWCQTNHAIAVANGTVALELCLAGLGIGAHYGGHADDEVIVTPRSFIASASVIVNAGAQSLFSLMLVPTARISRHQPLPQPSAPRRVPSSAFISPAGHVTWTRSGMPAKGKISA